MAISGVSLFTIFGAAPAAAQSPGRSQSYVVIGYVTGSGWPKHQIETKKMTHINYAFANPVSMTLPDCLRTKIVLRRRMAKPMFI